VLGTVLGYASGAFNHKPVEGGGESPNLLMVQAVATVLGFLFATWAVGRRATKLSWEDLRWKPFDMAGKGWGLGLVLGVVAAAAAVLLALPLGGARFSPDQGSFADYLRQGSLTTLILAPAALGEEIAFRGVAQVLLARIMGRWGAIVLLSVLFGLAHLFNPNPTPLAIANITLAGIFLGAAFYLPGGIWTAWGAHLGWNATLALMDAPVSGLPFTIPLINYDPGGPQWLTGGNFGPEGGALGSCAIILGIFAVMRLIRRGESV
ncbi:MAG TPA: CPBP family intramembrane glutamic endopeptidase, partial [Gemmatimonadales bacterium]|nr:CPBP family intramembrane glutamic endopeptidase [Gemmatimonadales bacterium]